MIILTAAGRLTKDAVLRYTTSGTAIAGFTVATDVGFGDKKHAVFIGCSLFGKRAEALAEYLLKGSSVTVSGNADLRLWESNGKHGAEITLNVQEVALQGGRSGDSGATQGQQDTQRSAQQPAQTGFKQGGFREEAEQDDFEDQTIPF